MIGPDLSRVEIFIRPGVTDMRKQVNGLSIMATEEMELDPLSGALFLFCNRYRKILKAIYWDATGFAMWMKKLERDRFPWPQTEEAARKISSGELRMLLEGIDFWQAHQKLSYRSVS
jgi:transposase